MMPKPSVLDSLEEIKNIDRSNMLSFCTEAPKHYSEAARMAEHVRVGFSKPRTIIIAGMGGSAIGGELLKDWTRDRINVPVEVCREYSLPAYADEQSLVFVSSYSGETEETLSALLDALKRKCMVVCISSGGRLEDFAEKLGIVHLRVPGGMAPRATLPYMFMPMPVILQKLGLVSRVENEISETVKILKRVSAENLPEKKAASNFSKTLASSIHETVPVIYGFGIFRAVAQRFKTQVNENSKNPAKWEYFPELNHNEIVGWEAAKTFAKWFSVIFIRDIHEPVEIRQRIEATKEIMRREKLRLFKIQAIGKSSLARMASVICTGDFTSVYLAVLRGIDPTPVRTITFLKERLKRSGVKERTIRELQKLV
jgi:glucose/mannose-6-phosphate isomerase